ARRVHRLPGASLQGRARRARARGAGARSARKEPALRFGLLAVVCCLVASATVYSQSVEDPELLAQPSRLVPDAVRVSAKEGSPPHFKAYGSAANGAEPELVGLAFWTTELEPLERAYDGPIKMLVGMDAKGELTGVVVVEHREPYGYFS